MSEVLLQIDGKEVRATEGASILEAAREAGVFIPTLCHHEKLEPHGGCRLCMVEVEERGRSKLVVSCVYPAAKGQVVTTRSEQVDKIRKMIIELLMAHAPDSETLLELGREYGADRNRFDKEASFCINCGLCVRYCAEVKKADAVGFLDRGTRRDIAFVPEIAARECWQCKECFPLCPTSALQAAYVLVSSLAFPEARHQAPSEC